MTYADRIPAPRPIPNLAARLADARRCGHTPEQHRHDGGQNADRRSQDRAIRELAAERDRLARDLDSTQQVATYRQTVIDQRAAELGAAQELLAVVDDLAEQLDRARARYATRPEAPVEPEKRQLQHVSVLDNCIACGARCPNGRCPNDVPAPGLGSAPPRAQEDAVERAARELHADNYRDRDATTDAHAADMWPRLLDVERAQWIAKAERVLRAAGCS